MKISTLQIGRCGELLVQRQLLMAGVDSAELTTDTGIDLLAYSNRTQKTQTIQVKTTLEPVPAGGKGQLQVHWWLPEKCPADLAAFVDLSTDRIWLMTMAEVREVKQQLSASGFHITMYTEYIPKKTGKKRPAIEYDKYLFENRFNDFF